MNKVKFSIVGFLFFLAMTPFAGYSASKCQIQFLESPRQPNLGDFSLEYEKKGGKLYLARSTWTHRHLAGTLFSQGGYALNENHHHLKIDKMEAVDILKTTPLDLTTEGRELKKVVLENVMFLPNSWNDNSFVIDNIQWNKEEKYWVGRGELTYSSWVQTGEFAKATVSSECFPP